MEESRKSYSKGYLAIAPRRGKLTVSNLVNFGEASGAYGVADRSIVRWAKSAIYFIVYIVVCVVLSFIVKNWFVAMLLWIALFPLPFRLISLFVWDEKRVKRDYLAMQDLRNSPIDYSNFIGFYDVSDVFPYIISYTDGTLGVALELIRKTEVGNIESRAFDHSQQLAFFYGLCGSLGLIPELIDTQALNSHDERFDTLYAHLNDIENETMESIMASMYHHWEDRATNSRLTHEYFIVRGQGDLDLFTDNINELRRALKGASYRAVRPLDIHGLGSLIGDTFGIKDFPIKEAMSQVVRKSGKSTLRLLWVGDKDNKRKVIAQPQFIQAQKPNGVSPKPEVVKKPVEEKAPAEMLDLFEGESSVKEDYKGMTTILADETPAGVSEKGFEAPVTSKPNEVEDLFAGGDSSFKVSKGSDDLNLFQ